MPIYEYHCSRCGDFEAMQKMSDKPLTQCPTCRRKVTKLISTTSFQLKGSGWYVTDYARKDGGAKQAKKGDDKKTAEKATATDATSGEKTSSGERSSGEKKASEKAAAA